MLILSIWKKGSLESALEDEILFFESKIKVGSESTLVQEKHKYKKKLKSSIK